MSDLFEKREATSFGKQFAGEVAPASLANLYSDDPLSSQYKNPVHSTRDLVRYLIACQTKRYGRVVDIPMPALTRQAKLYATKFTFDALARGVRYGITVCDYPFSLGFVVNKLLPEVEKQCPFMILLSSSSQDRTTPKTR